MTCLQIGTCPNRALFLLGRLVEPGFFLRRGALGVSIKNKSSTWLGIELIQLWYNPGIKPLEVGKAILFFCNPQKFGKITIPQPPKIYKPAFFHSK